MRMKNSHKNRLDANASIEAVFSIVDFSIVDFPMDAVPPIPLGCVGKPLIFPVSPSILGVWEVEGACRKRVKSWR
jgi:hypothetical protein